MRLRHADQRVQARPVTRNRPLQCRNGQLGGGVRDQHVREQGRAAPDHREHERDGDPDGAVRADVGEQLEQPIQPPDAMACDPPLDVAIESENRG
jgi:hypothetical protein